MFSLVGKWKGFKRLVYNWFWVIVPVAAELSEWANVFDWRSVLDPKVAPIVVAAVAAGNIVLQYIAKKETENASVVHVMDTQSGVIEAVKLDSGST